jgi:hypothetical protein
MDAAEPVMVVITEPLVEGALLEELARQIPEAHGGVVLVAPAIGETPLPDANGDVDAAIRDARLRLEVSQQLLAERGISVLCEVGVSDPVTAAAEALRRYPADVILIVAAPGDCGGWLENGHLARAEDLLQPPVRLVALDPPRPEPVAAPPLDDAAPRTPDPTAKRLPPLPRFSDGDPLAIGIAVIAAILGIAIAVVLLFSLF